MSKKYSHIRDNSTGSYQIVTSLLASGYYLCVKGLSNGGRGRMTGEHKVIGFIELLGKVNAIVVKNGMVEIQETNIKRTDCSWQD